MFHTNSLLSLLIHMLLSLSCLFLFFLLRWLNFIISSLYLYPFFLWIRSSIPFLLTSSLHIILTSPLRNFFFLLSYFSFLHLLFLLLLYFNYVPLLLLFLLLFPLLLYFIPFPSSPSSPSPLQTYAHHGVVYDMKWSKCDSYLLTASSDGTAKVNW